MILSILLDTFLKQYKFLHMIILSYYTYYSHSAFLRRPGYGAGPGKLYIWS